MLLCCVYELLQLTPNAVAVTKQLCAQELQASSSNEATLQATKQLRSALFAAGNTCRAGPDLYLKRKGPPTAAGFADERGHQGNKSRCIMQQKHASDLGPGHLHCTAGYALFHADKTSM
eukprot:m.463410 g.463410  ORF g.463410 m.463410 type:complete len:119 (+) comp20352_c0_seq85:198-554(+)